MGVVLSIISYLHTVLPSILLRTPLYEYAAFEKPRQIRLINLRPRDGGHLQCSLETVDLDNAPSFTALSYTHGPPVAPKVQDCDETVHPVPLICDGRELLIQPNLASALKQFDQLDKHGRYWIDAVCINQQDMLERCAQVMMMGDIYFTADRVLIWLGEEDRDSKIAVIFMEQMLPIFEDLVKKENGKLSDFVCSFYNPHIYDRLGIEKISTDVWDGLGEFLERRWFERAWTFQEALLAKKIDIFCGATKISWKRLERLLKHLTDMDWQHSLPQAQKSSPLERVSTIPGTSVRSTMKLRKLFFERDPDYQTYLGNTVGGDENIDMIVGYIDQMLDQMRFRSATDPRDHFFSLYGIASRICQIALPPLQNPLINPDYTLTVAEVYAANIKSLLAYSRSLLLLSHVEDRSQRRLTDLPSWVPDATVPNVPMLPKYGNGDIFNASKGALPQVLPAPNLETLSLVGHWVDTVTKIGDNFEGPKPYTEPYARSLPLLLKMPIVYATGQDRVEVFWRTLIANISTVEGTYPAPETMGKAFRKSLMVLYSLWFVETQLKGDREYQASLQDMDPLTALAKSSPEAAELIPSLEEAVQHKNLHFYIFDTQKKQAASETGIVDDEDEVSKLDDAIQYRSREEAIGAPFARLLNLIMLTRRIYLTESGLLGLGPESLKTGDHIFILPGARVPFVLRPISLAGGRPCYEMVGETYVHGIMQGEALGREDLKTMDIDMV
jgi:Heterokaryon incompatibility protein (HET)